MASLIKFYQTAIKKVPVYKYSGVIFIALIFLVIASKFKFNTDDVIKYSVIILGLCFLGFLLAFFTKTQDVVVRISLYILIYSIVLTTALWILGLGTFLATDGKYPKMIGKILNYMNNQPDENSPQTNDSTNIDSGYKTPAKSIDSIDSVNVGNAVYKVDQRVYKEEKSTPLPDEHDNQTSEKGSDNAKNVTLKAAAESSNSIYPYTLEKKFSGNTLSISTVNSFNLSEFNLDELDLDRDFQISVRMKSIRPSGSTRFGIAWNFYSWQDFFLFTLHNEGRTSLTPPSSAFTIGRGKCNCDQNFTNIYWGNLNLNADEYQDLVMIKNGNTLKFYVNQLNVWSSNEYKITSTKIAYWVADNSNVIFEGAWYFQ